MLPPEEIFIRLLVALFLGMLIGLDRILTRNDAGIRTYGLMCMGSALFMIIAAQIGNTGNAYGEVLRVLGQIVTGIGFLGAGLIFFSNDEHKRVGMTSAAGMWVTAGIGASVGIGFYNIAVYATFLMLITLTIIRLFELKLTGFFYSRKKAVKVTKKDDSKKT